MASDTFFTRFRGFVMLCSLAGIYLPGAERLFPFKSYSLVMVYIGFFFTIGWFNAVDSILITLNNELTTPMLLPRIMIMHDAVFWWVMLTSIYMLTQQKNFKELIEMWDGQLQPELYQKKRQEILNEQTRLTWRKLKVIALMHFLPSFTAMTNRIVRGQFIEASMLGNGMDLNTESLNAVPQMVSYACWAVTYGHCRCLFTLVLRLILAELKYLKYTLDRIFSDLIVNPDGSLSKNANSDEDLEIHYEKACEDIQTKLRLFVKHHIKVLALSNIVKKIYSPIVFVEFCALTTFLCGHVYCAAEGFLEPEVAFGVAITMGYICFHTSLNCTMGENILDMCCGLGDAAFYGNWMAYPPKIQKWVVMIVKFTNEKPIVIEPFLLFRLLRATFRQMTYLQYQLFTFLLDVGVN